MVVNSVFTVTEIKGGKRERVTIEGYGQKTIKSLRQHYPRFTKFVFNGFEYNGEFKPLKLK